MDVNIDSKRLLARLRYGAVKRAVIASLIVAFFALALFAGVGWYFAFQAIWAYAVAFVGVFALSFPLFYFLKYRKTGKEVAAAIDELGLEERVLTMESLKGDDSYIARRQREDTIQAIKTVDEKRLSLALSTLLLICLAVALPLGAGLTTVSALAAEGVLPSGQEVTQGIPSRYSLIYTAGKGGTIKGKTKQRVTEGTEGGCVIAVADEGYVFVKWSDGNKDAVRIDIPKGADIKVKAVFEQLSDYFADEEFYAPGEQNGASGNKQGSEQGGDDGRPMEGEEGDSEDSDDGSGDGSGSGGGGYSDESYMIIDGETVYTGKVLDDARINALDRINNDPNLSEKDKQLIDDYYSKIEK